MEFMGDAEQAMTLKNDRARAEVAYLTDIFVKLNVLNQELQGLNKTLLDAKTKVFGFVDKLRQMRREVSEVSLPAKPGWIRAIQAMKFFQLLPNTSI